MANQDAIFRYGYDKLARQHGFRIADAASSAVSPACPTLVWSEHGGPSAPPAAEIARRAGLALSAASIMAVRVVQKPSGFVAVFPAEPRARK